MKELKMKKILAGLIVGLFLGIVGCGYTNITSSSNSSSAQQVSLSTNLQYFFTKAKQNPDQELIKVINTSSKTLDVAIYSITRKDIVGAIISAKQRGVIVRIITDKECSVNKSQKAQLALLKGANIPIRVNTHSGLMHLKLSIEDGQVVTTGSFNYTAAASTVNDEVLVIIKDSKVATDFTTQFNDMWNDNEGFRQY